VAACRRRACPGRRRNGAIAATGEQQQTHQDSGEHPWHAGHSLMALGFGLRPGYGLRAINRAQIQTTRSADRVNV
jgi:hypothetical protein